MYDQLFVFHLVNLSCHIFLIEKQYGKCRRTWLIDCGIPTEKTLEKMRSRGID
jgi:hypothetical protein